MQEYSNIDLKLLEELVQSNPDDPSHHFNLGKCLWEKGIEWREKAAERFLMAAKLNPQNGEAFKYLGHYYSCFCMDTHRSLKCYQRAVSLNADDAQSGEALCNLLDVQSKESLEVAICREASGKSPRAFWAFSRLGFLLIHQNKWSEAIQSLQHAIRGYPSSADLWEALGLAYQRLGMYTAAIKSYGRAMELETSRAFAMIETGNIFLMLGSYRKGVEQFQHALKIWPQNLGAQYGLASGLLASAQECSKQGAFSWATSLLEEASEIAKACAIVAGNMFCVWKLHADIQLTYAKCFPWTEGDDVKGEEAFNRSLLSWKKKRRLAAVSANRSYQRALHLVPWQANIYMDIAVTVDLMCSLQSYEDGFRFWKLTEKMLLGSLLLEGDNHEFWMALGCMSDNKALKQHAFIRGLHLDVSLASAWAYLGKIYKEEGKSQLGRQAFDRARSIDPSLALPWAGMSSDILTQEPTSDEAYESCLRAVQIMPFAEFQIGLAKLALRSNHLLSPEVYGAIKQALQCAPWYSESHNLNGLISEARHDYESAVASYRLAHYALKTSTLPLSHSQSHFVDISVNLSRALCKVGYVQDAVQELEDLKGGGLLNIEGLQIYAFALWELGQHDRALLAIRELAKCIPTMKLSSAVTSICLICSLQYSISGAGSTINSILKMPRKLLQSTKVSFIISAIDAVHQSYQLQALVSSTRYSLSSQEEIMEMHLLIALSKLMRSGQHSLSMQNGIDHLRKALHMYPNGSSLRNMLGYFLLSRKQRGNDHVVRRCCVVAAFDPIKQDFRSSHEIIGAEAVACLATSSCKSNFLLPTCIYQSAQSVSILGLMQRWFHREPWNHNTRYLLVLGLLQIARQTKYPQHLMSALKRMTNAALTSQLFVENTFERYKNFQLLLCSSELSLHGGDPPSSVSFARDASNLSLSNGYTFFAHLQLCRAYAAVGNHKNLSLEFTQCLNLRTDYPVGWMSLMIIESLHRPQNTLRLSDNGFRDSIKENEESENSWLAVYSLFCGLVSLSAQDFLRAEEFLTEACSLKATESCIFLCHGAVCMALGKENCNSHYLTMGIKSLRKAQMISSIQLPYISLLLAQAEASLGSKLIWKRSLPSEWYSWSPEAMPAEIYFQMHLLALGNQDLSGPDYGDSLHWALRAIHLNPSCVKYWKILRKLSL
ncbi:tetratricopeptide repeat protein SKI3 isoform X2 [Amaranthus tricolor]|nr:tetratricopeptide repeat protein SKI3 isoform X2 [Amaranthus tricolor]